MPRDILSPGRRRRVAQVLLERYRAPERLAWRVVGQHRSTRRCGSKVMDLREAKLRQRLREFAADTIRWARCMVYRLLRWDGCSVIDWVFAASGRSKVRIRLLPGSEDGFGTPTGC